MAEGGDGLNQPGSPSDIGSTVSGSSTRAAAGTTQEASPPKATTDGRSTQEQQAANAQQQTVQRASSVSNSVIEKVAQGDEHTHYHTHIHTYPNYPDDSVREVPTGIGRQASESNRFRTQSESQHSSTEFDRQVSESTRSRLQSEGQLPEGDFNWVWISDKFKIDRNRPLCKYAEVYHAEQSLIGETRREVAIKLLKKTDKSVQEARFLVRLDSHPNIVRFFDSGDCVEGPIPQMFIAMELCDQNLDQYVKNCPFDLRKASSFVQQTVSAINHMHVVNIAHGDLKPSNILVTFDKKSVKVSDFGVSKAIPGDKSKVTTTSGVGTEGFKAPESYGPSGTYGYKADIYPLAITGYFIFTHGKHPFGPYSFDWVHNIVHNKSRNLSLVPLFPEPRPYRRPQLIQLFKHMLEYEPKDRPSAQEVQNDIFFDDSFQGIDAGRTLDATHTSIVEVLQNSNGKLLPDAINKLTASLITAEKKLKDDKSEEGVQLVRQAIPEALSAEEVNKIGKKFEDEYPVFSLLLHYIACKMFHTEDASPDDAVNWISERVSDIRCATEQIMKSESTGNTRYIAIKTSPKFMKELLEAVLAVEKTKRETRTLAEVSCIISITRINIDAGKYPDVEPNGSIITMCKDGLVRLENVFQDNVRKYKYYGYLLNNMGEACMQLRQFGDAEEHFKKAIAVKKEATYRSLEAKSSDVSMTRNNLHECQNRKNSQQNLL